jgi:cation:H+ antiporter
MMLHLLLLLAGFVVLIKGADLFVDGAAALARTLGISSLAVGLTVVAFGSALPELFVNLSAAIDGHTDIALGTGVGSTIANLLLVLGIAALIRPLVVSTAMIRRTIPFCLLAAIILWTMAADSLIDGGLFAAVSQSDGLILLAFFVAVVAYSVSAAAPLAGLPQTAPTEPDRAAATGFKTGIGLCGLLFGGRWVAGSAAVLGDILDIPQIVVGVTMVALGTCLPELAASVMAARRGDVEIAVGNAVGSSIFNLFFILGASAVIRPLPVVPATHVDLGVMTAAAVMLVVFLFAGRVRIMGRPEGLLALLLYGLYLAYLLLPLLFPDASVSAAG